MVLFGGTGDLALRKLVPALYLRHAAGQIGSGARVIAVARTGITREEYLAQIEASCREYLRPEEFNFMKSFEAVIMVVLGGMGSISGATLAGGALALLTELLRSAQEYRMVAYALLLILVMILRPQGLFGTHEIWELIRRRRKRAV